MGLIAKNEGIEYEKLEDGVYTAVSSMLIDLGVQNNERFEKKQRKFIIVWQILGQTIEINGEEKPRVISKEYTLSLNEKSKLRADLQAWRGKAFTPEELNGFDLVNILNKACQLQIITEEKNNKPHTNIASIMAMPKGMQVAGTDDTVYFNTYEPDTFNNFGKIPKWIQDKIRNCENKAESKLDLFIQEYDNKNNTNNDTTVVQNSTVIQNDADFMPNDDLPF
jgi:hypothetical protein